MNMKGLLVFDTFQGLIHIFKDDFTKFKNNLRTKGSFFKFHEFSRTKVKFKDFSRSVHPEYVNLHQTKNRYFYYDIFIEA